VTITFTNGIFKTGQQWEKLVGFIMDKPGLKDFTLTLDQLGISKEDIQDDFAILCRQNNDWSNRLVRTVSILPSSKGIRFRFMATGSGECSIFRLLPDEESEATIVQGSNAGNQAQPPTILAPDGTSLSLTDFFALDIEQLRLLFPFLPAPGIITIQPQPVD